MFHQLLKLFYRVVSPTHPRGWLDFHSVHNGNGTTWVHCHGMEKWKLPNIEFVDVPEDLPGYAHGIAMSLLDYMKNQKRIGSGEHFGGALVSENQMIAHFATLHEISRPDDEHHNNVLRVVDYKEDKEARFPFRLFAGLGLS